MYIRILSPLVPVMYTDTVTDGMLKGLDQQIQSMRYNIIDSAEKRAREEGRITERLQNAKKMKVLGIDAEIIMQVTGLDLDAISNL